MRIHKPLLAALVACLLFVAYLHDRHRQVAARRQLLETARLIPFDVTSANFVRVVNSEGEFVAERRDDGTWWLTQPIVTRADANQIRTIVDNFHASKKSTPFTPPNLADYGLDAPLPRVTVRGTRDGRQIEATLLLGADTNRIGRVYAMIEGEPQIFTVGDWIRNQGLVGLQHLRDRSLMRFNPDAVREIRLRFPEDSITARRREGADARRGWWIEEMDRPASDSLVDLALATLSTASAVRIDDTPTTSPVHMGFERPILDIELALDGEQPSQRLTVGRRIPGEDRFWARSPHHDGVVVVRAGYIEPLVRSRIEWGTRRFFWLAPGEYQRIETSSGSMNMVLVRDDAGVWSFEEFPDLPLHPERLMLFLDALGNWAGTSFVEEGLVESEATRKYGLRDVSYQVRATRPDGRVDGFHVGVADPAEGTVFVRRLQDNSIWKADADRVHFVRAFRADLQDKRIDHGWSDAVRRIVYHDPTTGTGFVVEERNGVWMQRREGYPSYVLASVAVADFLHIVEELEWESIASLVGQPPVKARLDFRDGAGNAVFWLEELDSGREEGMPEKFTVRTPKGVFDVKPQAYRRLFEQWVLLLRTARESDAP